jgi:hypothetical protein
MSVLLPLDESDISLEHPSWLNPASTSTSKALSSTSMIGGATPPATQSNSLARSWSGPRLRKPRSSFTSPLSIEVSNNSDMAAALQQPLDLSWLCALRSDGVVELLDALLANASLDELRVRVSAASAATRLNSQRGFDVVCVRNERLLRCLELVAATRAYAALVPVLLNELPVPTLCGAAMAPPADSGVYLAGTAGAVAYDAGGRRLLLAAGEPFGIVLMCQTPIARVCVSWRAANGVDFWRREHRGNADREAIVACFDAHRPVLDEQYADRARVVALQAPTLPEIDLSNVGVLLVFVAEDDVERICCTVAVDVWRGSSSQQSALNRIVPHF